FQGLLVESNGVIRFALVEKKIGQVEQGIAVLRLNLQSLLITPGGLIGVAEFAVNQSQVCESISIPRVDRNRRRKGFSRFLQDSLAQPCHAKIVVERSPGIVDADRA